PERQTSDLVSAARGADSRLLLQAQKPTRRLRRSLARARVSFRTRALLLALLVLERAHRLAAGLTGHAARRPGRARESRPDGWRRDRTSLRARRGHERDLAGADARRLRADLRARRRAGASAARAPLRTARPRRRLRRARRGAGPVRAPRGGLVAAFRSAHAPVRDSGGSVLPRQDSGHGPPALNLGLAAGASSSFAVRSGQGR